MITQAIIAAGGFGTRLRPFTDNAPKPMIPILGRPLLEWHVEQFRKHGVTEVLFTLHHMPETVTGYFGDGSKWGVRINYFVEKDPLGSAGALKALESRLGENFYYIFGDTFSLMDYSRMADEYSKKENPIGMQRVKLTDDHADADVVELGSDGAFAAVHKKPHIEKYPNAYRLRGSFILNRRFLSYVPGGKPSEINKEVLQAVVAAGEKFYGYESDDYSKGIDTDDKWREVEDKLLALGFPGSVHH